MGREKQQDEYRRVPRFQDHDHEVLLDPAFQVSATGVVVETRVQTVKKSDDLCSPRYRMILSALAGGHGAISLGLPQTMEYVIRERRSRRGCLTNP